MKTKIAILAITLLFSNTLIFPQSLPTAATVVKKTNDRDDGQFVTQTLTLVLINKKGSEKVQITKAFRKYYGEEKRQTLFYTSPSNIKGTAFLTFDYPQP
ncbi:MAG: hypothetical protein JKY42_04465, partial [Flavobacteriales bacterium]|nr:hypothetical protein [Flavobacteriales bacterium]